MKQPDLRNRANAPDRPHCAAVLRTVPCVAPESNAPNRCKVGEGHEHVFVPFDRYGCCKVCGDEVLT